MSWFEICNHYLRLTQHLFNLVCIEAKLLNNFTPILYIWTGKGGHGVVPVLKRMDSLEISNEYQSNIQFNVFLLRIIEKSTKFTIISELIIPWSFFIHEDWSLRHTLNFHIQLFHFFGSNNTTRYFYWYYMTKFISSLTYSFYGRKMLKICSERRTERFANFVILMKFLASILWLIWLGSKKPRLFVSDAMDSQVRHWAGQEQNYHGVKK